MKRQIRGLLAHLLSAPQRWRRPFATVAFFVIVASGFALARPSVGERFASFTWPESLSRILGNHSPPTSTPIMPAGTTYTWNQTAQVISGTLFDSAGLPISGKTIKLLQNGTGLGTTDTDLSGNYSFTGLTLASGDKIAVYISGEIEKGATVTLSGTADITNLDIRQNVLIVRTDNGGAITNKNLREAEGGVADPDLTAVRTVDPTNVLSMPASLTLEIWTASTYAPGADINDMGNWRNNGTFVPGTHTVTFSGISNQTIAGTSSTTFNALTIANTGTSPNDVVSLDGSAGATDTVVSHLTITGGVFDQGTELASSNLTTVGATTRCVEVRPGATWRNRGRGDETLSCDVLNEGTIEFNAAGQTCGDNDEIQIRSSIPSVQRTWEGPGTFSMIDVDVRDQTVPGGSTLPLQILVNSGTNSLNNTGWNFNLTCAGPYTWIGGAGQRWADDVNWSPIRPGANNLSTSDVLIFDGSVTPATVVEDVQTQTNSAIRLQNGAVVTLHANIGGATLTLEGATGNDLDVPAGTFLTVAGGQQLIIELTAPTGIGGSVPAGHVAGQILMKDDKHQLIGDNAGEIIITGGLTIDPTYSAITHPFGEGTNGSVVFESGSTGVFNSGLDPFGGANRTVVTFNSGSTAHFLSTTAFFGNGGSYGNLILDGDSQNYFQAGANQTTILNNFRLVTGNTFVLSSTPGADVNLFGNFRDETVLAGQFNANGRTLHFKGATQTIFNAGSLGTFSDVSIAQTPGGKVQLLSNTRISGHLNLISADSLLELNGQTLELPGTIAGPGNLKGDPSANMIVGDGNPGALGTVNFLSGGRTLSSLQLNHTPNGSMTLGTDLALAGSLRLDDGILNTGANTLSLSSTSSVIRTDGFVNGNLQKSFGSSGNLGSFTFPLGTANAYSPLNANVTANSNGTLTVKAVQGKQPNIPGANALQRYWTLNGSGITANLTFHYSTSPTNDVVGNEANYKIFKYDGSFTEFTPDATGTNSASDHFATVNNISSFSDWTLAEPASLGAEIDVQGGSPLVSIPDGAASPQASDGTDFGTVSLGNSLSHTFTILNTGSAALNLTGTPKVDVTGTNAADFVVTAQPSSPIAASAGTTFTIQFTPGAAGPRTATVNIANDDADESAYDFAILGTGLDPTCAPPPTGMAAWYPGDGNARDIKGGNHGTLQNAATFGVAKVNQGFSLDGTNQYVEAPDTAANSITGPISIDAWINPATVAGAGTIVSKYDASSGNFSYVFQVVDGKLAFSVSNNGSSTAGTNRSATTNNVVVTANAFTHVGVTYDTATEAFKFYANGVEAPATVDGGSGSVTAIFDGAAPLRIGSLKNQLGTNADFFNGVIDEVELFNVVVSAADVASIYNASYLGKCRASEIDVKGNNNSITDGSTSPSATNDTDFGSVTVGDNATHTFTVYNTGTAELNVTSISVSGANASDFSPGPLTPAGPIAPQSSATFIVTFAPGATGPRTTTVHIANDDSDEGDYDFAIQGNGICATPPTPTASNDGPYCEGATIQLSTPTVSGATYSWTGPNGFTSSAQNPTRTNATTADAGTYSVTITVNGCTSAAGSTNVVVNATPATPTASNGGPYCEGAAIQLSTPTVSGATYSWTGPNGFTSSAQNPTRTNATTADAGTYSVTITVNGCTSAAGSTNVVVNATPATPTASNGGPYCEGATIQLSTPTVSGATYSWTGPNGFTSSAQNPTRTNATTADAGTYSVTITVNGCTSAAGSTNVVVNATPATPTASNGGPYCEGATIQLSTPTVSGATYSWTGPNGFTSSAQNPTRTNATTADAGTYSVTITVNGCTSAAGSTNVVVNATPATPTASNGGPYCEGATIQLSTPTVSGATYSWTGPNGFTSSAQNPTRTNATTADAGTYSVTITVNGCTSAAGSTNVVVNATPATPTASNGGPYCEGATISLSTPTVAGATYSWTGPNGFTSSLQNPTRTNATTADAGTYSVTITVNGCTSAAGSTNVVVNATPATPTASNGGPYVEGATISLSTPTVAGATYSWTGSNGFTSADQNPTRTNATTADAGTYSVSITVNGCPSAAGTTNVVVTVADTDISLSAGSLVITDANGGNSDDAVTLSLNGSNVRINDPNHVLSCGGGVSIDTHTCEVPLSSITGSIQVNTMDGNDSLTLALAGGSFFPPSGVTYAGGAQTTSDTLLITGGNQGTVTYQYTNANGGSIAMSNVGTVTYTGLEPISNTGSATDIIFELPAGPNAATLGDDGTVGNTMSRLSGATFETTDFANPTGSLAIKRGNAADTIAVNALPDFNSSLTIGSAGNEFSAVTFNGAITLASNNSLATNASGTITLSNGGNALTSSGTGTISLTAADVTGAGNVSTGGGLTISNTGASSTLSGVIAGTGGLTKLGAGTLVLSGANTYTGATAVNAGRLNIDGSIDSNTTVNSGNTLGGTGTINTAKTLTVNSGGVVAPGTSPGILNTGSVTFNNSSSLAVEIGGTTPGNAATNHDQLNVTGTVSLGNAVLGLSSFNGFVPSAGQSFVIISNDGTDGVAGTFNSLGEGATISNFLGSSLNATITYQGGTNSNDVVLTAVAPPTSDLTVTKSAPASVTEGNNFTYTITVSNSASATATATGVSVSDTLPAGVTFVSVSPMPGCSQSAGTVTCTGLPDIPAGGSDIVTIVVTAGSAPATVLNAASASATNDPGSPHTSNQTSTTITAAVCVAAPLVTNTGDNGGVDPAEGAGTGTLRQALVDVCDGGTITFDTAETFSTPQTITLSNQLTIGTDNVTIDGPDPAGQRVTIAGGGTSRLFSTQSGKTTTIRDLTLTGGLASGLAPANLGGAIYNDHATLTLTGVTVSGNTAGVGGGIYNDGNSSGNATLTIVNSTISGNTANAGDGGGIYNFGIGTNATLNLTNSTLSGNNAQGSGGGISTDSPGGGASPITITNSTITNNRADNNTDSTGIGGGLVILGSSEVTLRNSIVALNFNGGSPSTTPDDIRGALVAGGTSTHNLIGSCLLACGLTNGVDNNTLNISAASLNIAALAANGAINQTHALLPGSNAIEAGNNAYVVAPPFLNVSPITDERGTGFPRVIDSADADAIATVDIGAFELSNPTAADGNVGGRIVDAGGNPIAGAGVRMSGSQNRLTVTDADGNYYFANVETNGFYTVTPTRANFSFSPAQRSFNQLGQHTEAAFTGVVNTENANPLDRTEYFVRQQYLDFLNREPDEAGFKFWVNNIESCGSDAACIEVKRIATSAAFFLSIEFKQTGGMVREFYVAALDRPMTSNMPHYVEFMRDTQAVQRGLVVGQGNWQRVLDANRTAFTNEFVMRAEFVSLYPTTDTPTQYVDKLYRHANVAPVTVQERLDAIREFGGAITAADPGARGRALLRITQNANFQAREANLTFVQIEYFGYLRRNPNDAPDGNFNGFNFWAGKLNQFNGDFMQSEMVKAFIISSEYRQRFGP